MNLMRDQEARALLLERRNIGNKLKDTLTGQRTPSEQTDLCRAGESEFCWGLIWKRPGLTQRTRSALALAMVAAKGSQNSVKSYVRVALNLGWTPAEIEEILFHTQCYAGLPASLDAMDAAITVFAIECPDYVPGSTVDRSTEIPEVRDSNALREMGLQIRRNVLGTEMVNRTEERTREDPFIRMFFDVTHEYCFAQIWGRELLGQPLRSILSLGIASVLGQSGAVSRHVRSAVEIGLTKRQIGEVLLQAYVYGGVYSALNGFGVAQETFDAMAAEGIEILDGFDSDASC